jgi:hypothetical protein
MSWIETHCRKCGIDDSTVREVKLIGEYRTRLCLNCLNEWTKYSMSRLVDYEVCRATLQACIDKGTADEINDQVRALIKHKMLLFEIAERWVEAGEEDEIEDFREAM